MPRPRSEAPISCILLGSQSLLIQCGEILIDAGHDIRAVASREERIIEWATAHGIRVLAPGRDLAGELSDLEFDYLFSITHLEIIPAEILARARKACINFHDGPLPAYAGMYAPVWALLRGETEYGIAFHEMTEAVDEGPIFVERRFPIEPGETSLTLNARCYEAAIAAFGELVSALEAGDVSPVAQDLTRRSYFGRHERPDRFGVLDWREGAEAIERQVHALDFGHHENAFGSATIHHEGTMCLVSAASAMPAESGAESPAGSLLSCAEGGLTVATPDGAVCLAGFRSPSGSPLTTDEATERLGVSVGDLLQGPDPQRSSRLGAAALAAVENESFWVARLTGLDPIGMAVPGDAQVEAGNAAEPCALEIPAAFADQGSLAPAHAVVSAFATYVSRLCDRPSFDLAYSNDSIASHREEFGEMFADWVPLRVEVDRTATAEIALERIADALSLVESRGQPLGDLGARYPRLAAKPEIGMPAFGSVAIAISEDPGTFACAPGTQVALIVCENGSTARLLCDPRVFSAQELRLLRDRFAAYLTAIANGPEMEIGRLPLLDASERERVVETWNATDLDYDRRLCVHDMIEASAKHAPEAVALVCDDVSLSYGELLERSGRLANHLIELGVQPDTLVGIHIDRSIEMVVAVVAVLRAGGAYLPLDPSYPAERLRYMLDDSHAMLVVTLNGLARDRTPEGVVVISMAVDASKIGARPCEVPARSVSPGDLAYVIYTSGSTGAPKGVMIEHRNVGNFFAGMDERISHDAPGTWAAVTSLSFDISVLELLWTLTRGFKVVVQRESRPQEDGTPWRPIDFGLAMWGSEPAPGEGAYDLMLECARFGDKNGFSAFHTPERHFGSFGGSYPNPSVTGAAVAAVTSRIKVRSASVVLPLHHPVRVAEEWAVVDNLSGGRAEIAFASGWQPNDFVIMPENHAKAKDKMFESGDIVRRLWRGEAVEFRNPMGDLVPTVTQPRPIQPELELWMTTAGNVETFELAGARGYNLLTHLLGQSIDETAQKIAAYRAAREAAGLDPSTGRVTLMLHTYVGTDNDQVRELVRQPMKSYLASAVSLVMGYAWTFPAFARPGGPDSKPEDVDLSSLSDEEVDTILEFAFERYYETSGLFGTPELCADMVDRCRAADVNEICCLIDFGLPKADVLSGLKYLNEVRREAAHEEGAAHSLAAQVERHGVTHLQCTPTMARMLLAEPDGRGALNAIDHLMIGGEALPLQLAAELGASGARSVTNMYGPTETTVWSSTEPVREAPDGVLIGRPTANTRFYIMDSAQELLPPGAVGELVIGGEGVARGYLGRKELTSERFVSDPFGRAADARLYRTGDLARWASDGRVELLGRIDQQVKVRGHRIELGEIEARLRELPPVRQCAVVARKNAGGFELVAYIVAEPGTAGSDSLKESLRATLPGFMIPSIFVELDRLPQTPNGKLDRNALPAPEETQRSTNAPLVLPVGDLDQLIAGVWREVLCLDEVGIDDNFFDLGGHSLLVIQVHRKLRQACSMPVSLTDLYRFATIRRLSAFLSSEEDGASEVDAGEERGRKRRQAIARRRRHRGAGRT